MANNNNINQKGQPRTYVRSERTQKCIRNNFIITYIYLFWICEKIEIITD